MKKTLAKNTDNEFDLEVPFNTSRELERARSEFKKKNFPTRAKNAPCYEFYLQFLPTGFDIMDLHPNKDSRSLKSLVRIYGDVVGTQKHKEIKNKDCFKNTLAGFVDRYGKTKGTKLYNQKNKKLSVSESALKKNGYSNEEILEIKKRHSENSKNDLAGFIKRHGTTIGTKKFEEYINENHSSHWTTKYWVKRGYDEAEAKSMVSDLQRRDLKYFTDKYGAKDGFIRYSNHVKAKISNSVGKSYIEKDMIEYCKSIYKSTEHNHPIKTKHGNYVVDAFIPEKNLIIECFGDYWHCNPKFWDSDKYHQHLHMTAKEKQKLDNKRIKNLKAEGYSVIVLWETDIKKDGFKKLLKEDL
jgi:very-short-patch-repair endonuclease